MKKIILLLVVFICLASFRESSNQIKISKVEFKEKTKEAIYHIDYENKSYTIGYDFAISREVHITIKSKESKDILFVIREKGLKIIQDGRYKSMGWNQNKIWNSLNTMHRKLLRFNLINSGFGPKNLVLHKDSAFNHNDIYTSESQSLIKIFTKNALYNAAGGNNCYEQKECGCTIVGDGQGVRIRDNCPCGQILVCTEIESLVCKQDINDYTVCEVQVSCIAVCSNP